MNPDPLLSICDIELPLDGVTWGDLRRALALRDSLGADDDDAPLVYDANTEVAAIRVW